MDYQGVAMTDDFALIRIVKVKPPKNNKPASIDVKGLATSSSGDLDVLSTANGTTVKIVLAKKLVDDNQDAYSFNTVTPICVSPPGSTQPCDINNPLPTNWAVSDVTTEGLTLTVPALPDSGTGTASYKYTLYMNQTPKGGGTPVPITIDPRITNGGQPFEGSVVKTYDAGLSALTLVLLAILMLAAGFGLGWVLAGGRRP
jgi:hypothetical protein